MQRARRTSLVMILITVLALAGTAGPASLAMQQAGAQGIPPIRAAGLFTFPGDWSTVPAAKITVFYPARISWQYLTSSAHQGYKETLAGTSCQTCHQGQEKALGEELVKAGPHEPDPVAGKRGSIEVTVQAAFDDEYMYLRFEWPAPRPGASHDLWRFDGTRWTPWGGPKPAATKAGITPSHEDRVTLMLSERNIPADNDARTGFNQAGCFIACHNSMREMPQEKRGDVVRANPSLGVGGLGASDVRHYLLVSRTLSDETGGWDKVKAPTDLARLRAESSFLDLLHWRGYRSNPIGYADDGHVLEFRLDDAGRSMFTATATPTLMYDPGRTGFRAIPEARLTELLPQLPLIAGVNAVPIPPGTAFQTGDLLPQHALRTPEGSRADIMANGSWARGRWTVELRRKLRTGNPDDKPFIPGRTYRFGLAIFDDYATGRWHHVSFEQTLGMGLQTRATVRAARIGR